MNVRRLIPAAALSCAALLGLTALTACGSGAAGEGRKDGRLDVVASFYPLQFLTEQIGGDHVSVSGLTKPGVEPHDLEISARQTAKLNDADAVVYLRGLQPAVDAAVRQAEVTTKVDASTLTSMEKHGNEVGGHAAAHDHAAGEDNHGDDHGHSHSESGDDPHIWLDPVKYAEVARGIGAALAKADPAHAADYKKNTDTLVGKLDGLDKEYAAALGKARTKVFITTHAAFGYLAERYGLTEEAINGLDPDSEPSPARIKDLQKMAKADGVTTVFYETLVSDKTAKTLASDASLKTDVLDPLEGITDQSRGTDYFSVMRSNLTALTTALGTK
ncbi:metal ABC transporter substrate-binding protein [Streptomyces sp. ASQP_92]|uniref:metal ABC transporter substrate-binding protein n=1 Tax=Streptomyces sp. ASQP_92 TaxID=2979116 RepID=UPI0021C1B19C|nr:metal ABC transporter substrate-binding protein [Streptomyces sp. ASQP_92]MCT9087779.1 metal ABC transporter substrate-binding protein [Streptomyces sp. ASQP_92]